MEIDIKNIKAAYETATESEKTLLATLFPDLSLGQTGKAPDMIYAHTFVGICLDNHSSLFASYISSGICLH